jgi:CcmD family protein
MKNILTILILSLISIVAQAQEQVEMADKLRQDGKIWVVVAVIFATFVGLIVYLISIDRKVSKIEKELKLK